MPAKRLYVCSLDAGIDVICGRWKSAFLWKVRDAPLRFGKIRGRLPAVSRKMLTGGVPLAKQQLPPFAPME